jgi:ribonuclease R
MSKKNKKFKNKKKNANNLNKKALSNLILGIFANHPNVSFNYKQIAKRVMADDHDTRQLINLVLDELTSTGNLEEISRGKYKLKAKAGYVIGKVDLTNSGYGFVISEEIGEDVFISQNNLHHALNGDVVKVYVYAKRKRKQPEGEVIEIIQRARETFVGILDVQQRFAFLSPDDRKMPFDLFIPLDSLNGAKDGQKVIGKITDWPAKAKNPFGEVIEVLGYPGVHEVEMHAILAEYELPIKFPENVIAESEKVSDKITEEDYAQRRDFRDIITFTIDPEDAKDFDDALSLKKLDENTWEVGVHIADVSHYVKPKTLLDEDALDRGTSIYLVDRTIPMIPERISNNICSLRQDEEKLCFSAVFDLDKEAKVLKAWYGRTVIKSNKRFSYEEAQMVLDSKEGPFAEELVILDDLAQKLRARRFEKGAISFERDEVKFRLDEDGKPLGIYFKTFGTSNQLIEEFMLLANKSVAEFVGKKDGDNQARTYVYRIHDKPNQEKLESFSRFIRKFGYSINTVSRTKISESLNKLLADVRGKNEEDLIENLAVRSMAKAEYSTKNIGHYGLAFSHYSHFTSPIRRYPDIMAHRLLAHYLQGGKSENADKYEKMCEHSSEMERRAVEAERASVKFKQVEFMMDKVGQDFDGIISGITEWGIYVEIVENRCEGMIPLRDMTDDYYDFDEDNYCLVGRETAKIFQLGDKLRIKIVRANLVRKQLDFALVTE